MHRFLLHNDDIRDAGELGLSPGQVGLLAGWGVFSTLRVYDGVMFAFERHWERMCRDAARMRVPFPAQPEFLESRLQRLIEANQTAPGQPLNATLRVVIVRNRGGLYEGPAVTRDFDVIAFTVDMVRWPETAKLGVIAHGRHAASEVFITSTTRELLPVVRIDGLPIPGGRAVCDRLRRAFAAHVNQYSQYVKLRPNPVYN